MSAPIDEDRGPAATSSPEPHGEAALMLVESLIHGLLRRSDLSVSDALDVVQTAIDVTLEISEERGDDPAIEPNAVKLLAAISNSLRIDAR